MINKQTKRTISRNSTCSNEYVRMLSKKNYTTKRIKIEKKQRKRRREEEENQMSRQGVLVVDRCLLIRQRFRWRC